ncbi:hypothetical protein C3747_339g18 [Trypanosoma cruzi]|uniref:Flagellar attachment zone protein 1 conserved domain-containing protein n=1 Tax=Trypanosoma cruzi TaxID=5693 RepID=A0A2V2V776_TRYCR|nr:hypothetical protein C3747_339g18 [Trypanosoma cruzi]
MHSGHSGGQSANTKLTPPGTWQTVPNQRFASGAGAVPSYPDGFGLLPQQPLCAPNRSLLQVRDKRSQGLPCSRSWLSASLGRGSAASRRLPDPIGHCGPTKDPGLEGNLSDGGNSNEACANDLGYWTVMFMTKGGDRVGHSRVMAPRGKGPLTFEEVVGVIVEHASLLNLTVAYITYLGRDASIYTLLTPRTVQKRMDSFCVVVESKEDNPDLPSTRRQGKGTGVSGGELVGAEDCNEMQGLVGMATTANIMDEYRRSPRPTLPLKSGTPGGGLFRNVPSLTGLWQQQRDWSGLRTQSEKVREMQESWEMALTLLGKEEEEERKAIALDESSSWITLKVVEDRHAKALRKAERLRSHVIPLEPSRPYSATPKVWGGEGDEKKKDTRTEDKLQQPKRAASAAAQTSLLCGVICGYKWRALPSEIRPQIKEAVAQDIACRLDVPRTNITTDEYYGDSLIVQTAVEHDGTRTDAELQQSIATCVFPTVIDILKKHHRFKQSEKGFESPSQAKTCENATLGPELEADSILAPPTKDKQAAPTPHRRKNIAALCNGRGMISAVEEKAKVLLRGTEGTSTVRNERGMISAVEEKAKVLLRGTEGTSTVRNERGMISAVEEKAKVLLRGTEGTSTVRNERGMISAVEEKAKVLLRGTEGTSTVRNERGMISAVEEKAKVLLRGTEGTSTVRNERGMISAVEEKAKVLLRGTEGTSTVRNERGMISAVEEKAKVLLRGTEGTSTVRNERGMISAVEEKAKVLLRGTEGTSTVRNERGMISAVEEKAKVLLRGTEGTSTVRNERGMISAVEEKAKVLLRGTEGTSTVRNERGMISAVEEKAKVLLRGTEGTSTVRNERGMISAVEEKAKVLLRGTEGTSTVRNERGMISAVEEKAKVLLRGTEGTSTVRNERGMISAVEEKAKVLLRGTEGTSTVRNERGMISAVEEKAKVLLRGTEGTSTVRNERA